MRRLDGQLGDITITHRNGDVITGVSDQVTSALGVDLSEADAETVMLMANDKALDYKDEVGGTGNFDDCVTVVAAQCVTISDSMDGPVANALGKGAGVPAARLACSRIFPRTE
ncbi:MAG TPA: hypothetical protein VNM45_21535 [Bacillus sp. (in: firmicutes)]|nr:hypothetical protein [Bacillus sp. (in: firmicutes)]